MNIIDVAGSSVTVEFMSGLPNEEHLLHLDRYSISFDRSIATRWSMPEILVLANTAAQSKPTILLLDDFHLANQSVQPYFFKLLLQRQLGDFKLDDNVVIVLTINDSIEANFNGFNSALRNRISILPIEFNFDHWFNTFGRYIDYRVSSFLRAKSSYTIETESTGIEGYASARAWTSIAAELKQHTDEFILANASIIAAMQVSKEAANAFHKHIQFIQAINFEKVVANRQIIDISSKDLIEQFTYQYITNFIHTVEDGKYLLELCDANNDNKSFIGFLIGDISRKYSTGGDMTDGLQYVVDILIETTPKEADYKTTKQATLNKLYKTTDIKNIYNMITIASNYMF